MKVRTYKSFEEVPQYLKTRGMCYRLGLHVQQRQKPDGILDTRHATGGRLYPLFDIRKLKQREK
jgi:hypothetical protein